MKMKRNSRRVQRRSFCTKNGQLSYLQVIAGLSGTMTDWVFSTCLHTPPISTCLRLLFQPIAHLLFMLPGQVWFPHTRTSWQQCRQSHKKQDRCDGYSYPNHAQLHTCNPTHAHCMHSCTVASRKVNFKTLCTLGKDSSRAKCDAYSEPLHEVHIVSGMAVCARHGGQRGLDVGAAYSIPLHTVWPHTFSLRRLVGE